MPDYVATSQQPNTGIYAVEATHVLMLSYTGRQLDDSWSKPHRICNDTCTHSYAFLLFRNHLWSSIRICSHTINTEPAVVANGSSDLHITRMDTQRKSHLVGTLSHYAGQSPICTGLHLTAPRMPGCSANQITITE